MTLDEKTRLLGMFCAVLDGRDTREYILEMDSDQCVRAHNVLKAIDRQLKARWVLMGGPDDPEGEEVK